MTPIAIFAISGLAIVVLLSRPVFISNIISKGDIHIRKIYHQSVHSYSESKEKAKFFFEKQLPMHSRNFLNKLIAFLQEKREHYIGNMRDSRLLKKPDGISEFFKNMSEAERGNGEINETFENGSQNDEEKVK